MAINVNKMVVVSKTDSVEEAAPNVEVPPARRESLRNARSSLRRNGTPPDVQSKDNPHVVVGGKAKKIGKTSAYMLDMLALDD